MQRVEFLPDPLRDLVLQEIAKVARECWSICELPETAEECASMDGRTMRWRLRRFHAAADYASAPFFKILARMGPPAMRVEEG